MINKTTDEMRNIIRRKTVLTMPNRPSERGIRASDIKDALAIPICGKENSVLAELDRVVEEANNILTPLSKTVAILDEEYDNAYVLDETTFPTNIAFENGKDKTFTVAAGNTITVTVPQMVQGNRAGLNWITPIPAMVTFTNNSGKNLVIRAEQGVFKTIPNEFSDSITLSYAPNVSAVKLQTIVYCDGAECVLLITRIRNVTL